MATYMQGLRRGLPRTEGGDAWPVIENQSSAEITADVPAFDSQHQAPPSVEVAPAMSVTADDLTTSNEAPSLDDTAAIAAMRPTPELVDVPLRRGLPRVEGGDPWPPSGVVHGQEQAATIASPETGADAKPATAADSGSTITTVRADSGSLSVSTAAAAALPVTGDVPLRRGLPRAAAGEAWPPAGFAPASAAKAGVGNEVIRVSTEPSEAHSPTATTAPPQRTSTLPTSTPPASEPVDASVAVVPGASARAKPAAAKPASTTTSLAAKTKASEEPARKPDRKRYGSRTLGQWVRSGLLIAVGAALAAGLLVLAARGLTTFTTVQECLARYPGEYHLPAAAEPGFPAWVRWTHFLNAFFIVLIIRSGLQVRHQKKPPAFWSPRRGRGAKISINLWFHQSLDVLWLANGVIFVVLLFVSGHWMRIVPTSWEVFPNALSAMIQYMTLEWPVENGWVNYNSLQQLMYFAIVFIAAPLAAITGARMSDLWPKSAKRLNRIYPVELARALHFPTMLFFSLFIVVHVALVFSTGALRNLDHMFAGTSELSWTGFWWFAASIAAIIIAWFAARPILLTPIANLFGKVSSR